MTFSFCVTKKCFKCVVTGKYKHTSCCLHYRFCLDVFAGLVSKVLLTEGAEGGEVSLLSWLGFRA